MESLSVERLDHHGLVSGIVDELKLVEIIDNRLASDDQNKISLIAFIKSNHTAFGKVKLSSLNHVI